MKIILLFLIASVCAESQVRETETWIPKRGNEDMDILVSSGDFPNGFDLAEELDDEDDDEDGVDDYFEGASGSGEGDEDENIPTAKSDMNNNEIPDEVQTNEPKVINDDIELVQKNEVGVHRSSSVEDLGSNVLMSQASDDIFKKTEVIAALIAGGAVGLVIAGLLILLLVYRLKKKDEGTYDLGKRPIYKKAPTTEIYA